MRSLVPLLLLAGCGRSYSSGIEPEIKMSRLEAAEVCELVVGGTEHGLRRLSDKELCYISGNLLASAEAIARGDRFDRQTCNLSYQACATLGIDTTDLFVDDDVDCDKAGAAAYEVSAECKASVGDYEVCVDEQVAMLEEWASLKCDRPIYTNAARFDGIVPASCGKVMGGACAPGSGR